MGPGSHQKDAPVTSVHPFACGQVDAGLAVVLGACSEKGMVKRSGALVKLNR
jgi:hypothetical protein